VKLIVDEGIVDIAESFATSFSVVSADLYVTSQVTIPDRFLERSAAPPFCRPGGARPQDRYSFQYASVLPIVG
jgi:hypothetical protein